MQRAIDRQRSACRIKCHHLGVLQLDAANRGLAAGKVRFCCCGRLPAARVSLMGVGNRLRRLRATLQYVPSCSGRGLSQLAAAGGEWRPRLLVTRVDWRSGHPNAELDANEACSGYPQRIQAQTIANQDPDGLVLVPG